MHDQFLDSSQFPHNSPPRSAWGCALFALVVILAIVAVSALCGGCLSVVRIPLCHEQVSDEGEVTNRVWTTFFDKRPDLRVFLTVKMRCIVTAAYFQPIPPETKGRDLYQARQFKRWGWLPLAVVWATAPVDVAVDVVFLPYDIYAMGRSAKE